MIADTRSEDIIACRKLGNTTIYISNLFMAEKRDDKKVSAAVAAIYAAN